MDKIIFSRNQDGSITTNVSLLITTKLPDFDVIKGSHEFRVGYDGHGPNEFAANILWHCNAENENDCRKYAAAFRDEILHKCEVEGDSIDFKTVHDWMDKKGMKYRTFDK